MFCPSCGRQNEPAANYCVQCGARLPVDGATGPTQAVALPATRSGPLYAGFWKRVVAYVIDWIVLYVLFLLVALAFGSVIRGDAFWSDEFVGPRPWVLLAQLSIPWLYYALTESSTRQATLGKMALGIKVVDLSGRRVSFLRATGRFFGQFVSSMLFGIGYLMAGFTRRKQALHDMMAGCLVVNNRFTESDALASPPPRRLSGWVAALIAAAVLVPIAGIVAAVAIPAYQDYTVRTRLAEAATVGTAAARAVGDYYAKHQALPDDLRATGFAGQGRYVESVTFDRPNRTVVVTVNFEPVDGQRILYVASSPEDAPRIVWRCTSDGIPNHYLPRHCRSTITRL